MRPERPRTTFRIDAPPPFPTLGRVTSPAAAPAPPAIADYVLLRLIGRGSYGDVWLAHGVTGVHRAVKLVWRARFADAQPYEREFNGLKEFARVSLEESRQLALLHVGRGEDFFYYVMELADDAATGREIEPARYVPHTLRETMARRGRLPAREVVALAADLARALAGLHTRGLVHRDIKPSNVIFVGGVPKLADIGLVATASAELTFVGTEGYVPPEGPGAPSADVFSLGKLLYELATGLDRHDYPRLPADLPTLSDRKELLELNEILIRACDPLAARRHPDAAALLDELQLLQAGRSMRRLRAAERHLGRTLRIAAALAVAAGLAGIGAFTENKRARQAEAERDSERARAVYAANITQAQRAVGQANLGRARQVLESALPKPGGPDLRGFEWHALWHAAQGDPSKIVRDRGPAITRLVVSPDGSLVAAHDASHTATLFETKSFREVRRIAEINRLGGFSSDGSWLLGTTTLDRLQRWHLATGNPEGPPRGVEALRPLGPQGTARIVAYSTGGANDNQPPDLVIWDFATARAVARLPLGVATDQPPWKIFRAAIAPDGNEAVIACVQGSGNSLGYRLSYARLDAAPRVVHRGAPVRPGAIGSLPGSGERPLWWAADERLGRVVTLDSETNTWTAPQSPLPACTALLPLPGGPGLAAVEGTRIVLRSPTATTRSLTGHAGTITGIATSQDGTQLFSGSTLGELRVWSQEDWSGPSRNTRVCWNSESAGTGVVFSNDSRRLFVPEDSIAVAVLDARTLREVDRIPDMHHPLSTAADGVWGLAADKKELVRWSERERRIASRIGGGSSAISAAGFSPDRRHVALVRIAGDLCSGSPEDGELTNVPRVSEGIRSLLLDLGGRSLWSTDNSRRVTCRELPDGKLRWQAAMPALVADICWLHETTALGVALENGETWVLDAATGRKRHALSAGLAGAQALAAIPRGNRLLVAGSEGELHAFATESWTYVGLVSLQSATSPHVLSLAPDGRIAAVLTKSGMLHVVRTE